MSEVRRQLLKLAEVRGPEKTFCPSEAARALGGEEGWRDWMEPIRHEAAKLVSEGRLRMTQRGRDVHPYEVRGAIRLSAPSSD